MDQTPSFFTESLSLNFGSGGIVRSSGDLPYVEGSGYVEDSSLEDEASSLFGNGNITDKPDIVFLESNWTVPVAICIGLLILGTIIGNTLVILSVVLVKHLRTPYNILIVSLATTDLAIAALVMPLAALQELYGAWPLSNLFCDVYICLDMMLCTASILNLAAISLDRYLVITIPFQYLQRRTPRFMLLLVFISWAAAAAVSLPAVFGWRRERDIGECAYPPEMGFQLYATVVAFFLPTGVIIYVTIRIFVVVSKMAKADQTNMSASTRRNTEATALFSPGQSTPTSNALPKQYAKSRTGRKDTTELGLQLADQEKHLSVAESNDAVHDNAADLNRGKTSRSESLRAKPSVAALRTRLSKVFRPFSTGGPGGNESRSGEMKAVNTLGVFLGTFLLCWLPFFTMQLVNALRRCGLPPECVPMTMFSVLLWLGYAKSLCNPIINALYNRDIRRPFVEILRCRCATLASTLRRERYNENFGRGGPASKSGEIKKARCSDAASTSAAADAVRFEMAERGTHH